MGTDVRRGTSRFFTESSGIRTWHAFSFGAHYDPGNLGFGPLTCHDDHALEPGAGFTDHRHADVEIVTWVVSGELVHDGVSRLGPGQVAVQSAGSGITHREVAGPEGCRFVQAWLRPDAAGGTPERGVADVSVEPGSLVPLVGPDGPLPVAVAGASLGVVRLLPDGTLSLPAAPLAHVHVVTGSVTASGAELGAGDALRATGEPDLTLAAREETEVLVWRFASGKDPDRLRG
ncbi:pirin family protein [Nocardioides coralli]|uniref:pirin family protein n=1 Tax=Nocardioides coralli TaxID=2872154 RepID=UPI001CA38D00|nr:pirin family protein [Nocardioides coralli]QZY29049.1 pirin family protein [Nocardioides coralli]